MIATLLKALGLIFIAEMGDKTQVLAMAFATKYKVKYVVLGVFIGSLLNHALAVILGANLQHFIPLNTLSIIAGFSFILFGLWSFKFDNSDTENKVSKYGPILTVALAFFIGELGDKTQLTAIALSTDSLYPVFTLAGTVTGMVLTSLLGIFVGIKLGSRIDEFYMKIGAGVVFLMFGYIKLFDSLPKEYLTFETIISFSTIVFIISYMLVMQATKFRKLGQVSEFKIQAQKLKDYYSDMYDHVNDICLGVDVCGTCGGNKCLVGYTKNILLSAKSGKEFKDEFITSNLEKNFERSKVLESLIQTVTLLKEDWNNESYVRVHEVRKNFEDILYKNRISSDTYDDYLKKLVVIDYKLKEILEK